jgi:hypothetical protein
MNLDITPSLRDQQFPHLQARFSSFRAKAALTPTKPRCHARGYSGIQILVVCLIVLFALLFLQKERTRDQKAQAQKASQERNT